MRFRVRTKISEDPVYGAKRHVTKFAWLPKIVNYYFGNRCYIWLEKYTVTEVYREFVGAGTEGWYEIFDSRATHE